MFRVMRINNARSWFHHFQDRAFYVPGASLLALPLRLISYAQARFMLDMTHRLRSSKIV